jgi:hypothetical protein
LGYSIQLLLPFVFLATLKYFPLESISPSVFKLFYGIIWPEYWLQGESDAIAQNKAMLNSDPGVLLKMPTILCNDVFNNLLLVLTFGLCSPLLSLAIMCSVVLKMSMWMLLIGRFTKCILHDNSNNEDGKSCEEATSVADISTAPSKQIEISDVVDKSRDDSDDDVIHFPLAALAELYIPLHEVLAGSFWQLAWCSALFVAFLSWDMAADEVGRVSSVWVPLVPLGYVATLRCVAHYWGTADIDAKQDVAGRTTLPHTDVGVGVSQSPLHMAGNSL